MIDRFTFLGICEAIFGSRFYSQHTEDFMEIHRQCLIEYLGFDPEEVSEEEISKSEVSDDLPF